MTRWSLRLRIFLFFALLWALGTLAVAAGLWLAQSRGAVADPLALLPAFIVAAAGLAGATAWVWLKFDENVAKPLMGLARAIETRAHADIDAPVPVAEARYLGALGPSVTEIAGKLAEARRGRAEAMAQAAATEAATKARLESVLQRVDEAVIVSTLSHRILLANPRAATLLGPAAGLGRPLDRALSRAPLDHALDRLRTAEDAARSTVAVCTTPEGAILQARVALVPGETPREPQGYVLTIEDVTEEIAAHAERDRLLSALIETTRRGAANITAVLDALRGDPAMPEEARAMFGRALEDEAARLAEATRDHAAAAQAAIARSWPMEAIPAWDILAGVAPAADPPLDIAAEAEVEATCDSLALVALLRHLVARLGPGRRPALSATLAEPHARIDLAWTGAPVLMGELDRWLDAAVPGLPGEPTGAEVLARHEADLWPDTRADGRPCLRLSLLAGGRRRPGAVAARPEFYDFDLVQPPHPSELDATPLAALAFVVFDTETTGLAPSEGDEIIQIAAVRVLNGRVIRGETFDALVHPGRPIPPASTRIHGLSDADVAHAPPLATVLPRFHAFAEGAVLVAHNAAFDMAFLKRGAKAAGLAFDQPVLDTVFLSAFLHDHTGQHGLDALAARLGIAIDPDLRHTALGDALATAEVFVKLLAPLRARGIVTLGEALGISEEMHGIRRAQARY